jgi:hypothetical protein
VKAQTELFPKPEVPVKSLLGPVEKMFKTLIDSDALSDEESAVASLLWDRWHVGPITQRGIVKSKPWLGCHPKHEAEVVANRFESTTRRVRSIIRALRVAHKLPILADSKGYYLPKDDGEAKAYLERMEREARARAKASVETYHAMRDTLGLTSALFDELAKSQKLGNVPKAGTEAVAKAP